MINLKNGLLRAGLKEKKHQIEGVEWCINREKAESPLNNVRGGILADEMGLGKTTVMIGTILENPVRKTLIILPLALLQQWEKVIESWKLGPNKDYSPLIYHGENKKKITLNKLESSFIVLTTYGQVSEPVLKNKEDKVDIKQLGMIHQVKWDRIICDEAHHLRNKNTGRFRGVLRLKSTYKWFVTGTPIQNRKSDLYSLWFQLGFSQEQFIMTETARILARDFILKRTKEQVGIELPPVKTHPLTLKWKNENEKEISEQIHSLLEFAKTQPKTISNSVAALSEQACILPLLIRARQACIYPPLIKKPLKELMDKGLLDKDIELLKGCNHHSKIDVVVDKIKERKDNNRGKLIFCHFRGEIDVLYDKIKRLGLEANTFDGRTSHNERNEILTSKIDVLILQIQTGCEGLNLQQFKEVYFVSPHWNPAVEDQAVARCHRIGQDEPVDVFKFEMEGFDKNSITIERHCTNVQTCKRELSEDLNTLINE